jgi:hypothetical protein
VSGKFRLMTIGTFRVFAKESVTFTWPLWQDSNANDQDAAYP